MSEENQSQSPPYNNDSPPYNNVSPPNKSSPNKSQALTQGKQKISVNDAIEEFYRLKNSYETTYYDKYINPIIKNKKMSKKEKRVEYSKLPKNECINCKRQVGTIFSISSNNEEQFKKYIAKCGDITNPCALDIEIEYSNRELYNTGIIDNLNQIDKLKFEIIKEKNNALFFNKDVISKFETLTNDIKELTGLTGFLIEINILKNYNPEKINLLKKLIDEFGIGYIIPFKNMITQYIETDNIKILNEAINFYTAEMIPKLTEIQKLKYSVNTVDYIEFYDSDSSIYKLIQQTNSLQDNEYALNEDADNVVKFIKGGEQIKTNKTRKNKDKSSKSKTKKLIPISNIILEEEDNKEEDKEEDNRQEEYYKLNEEARQKEEKRRKEDYELYPRAPQYSMEGKDVWESRWG